MYIYTDDIMQKYLIWILSTFTENCNPPRNY